VNHSSDSSPENDEMTPPAAAPDLMTLNGRCFFKNAVAYKLPADFSLTAAELEEKLNKRRLTVCGALDAERRGWINSSPLGRTVHTVSGQHLIALGVHKKILPASMIRQEVEKRALLLADEQGHPVGRKQKRDLKDKVRTELLAKAMIRTTTTRAWLDTVNGWAVVEAAGAARAEKFLAELREALGTLAVVSLLQPGMTPSFTMAAWLRTDEAPNRLQLDTDLELQSPLGATVKYARHALDGEDIKAHLEEGKVVTRLGLTWNDRVSFVLTSKLELKRISFLTLLTEADSEEPNEQSAEDQFDADLTLMSDDFSQMLTDLSEALEESAVVGSTTKA
jgi:recombination associated protein RdgC